MSNFCPKCGKEIKSKGDFCSECGAPIKEQKVESVSSKQPKVNSFALAGFLISLFSIFSWITLFILGGLNISEIVYNFLSTFFTSLRVLGIVFSIIGVTKTGPSKDDGRGLAIAGIVIGAIIVVFSWVWSIIISISAIKNTLS